MKHWLGSLVAAAFLIIAPAAQAANSTVPAMTAATSVVGTDLFYCVQSAGTLDRKCTPAQMAAYIYGLMSGDATASGTGALTFATVNSNVGSFGSATQCAAVTVNAKGLITAISAATCTPAIGSVTGLGTGVGTFLATPSSANLLAALTTSTGTGNAVFGTAPTISSLNASVAMTLAFLTGGGTQCVQVSNTGVVSGTGSACGGSGSTGANPTATAGPTAVNGSATTFMRSDGSPAVQAASNSQKGLVQCDGTTIVCPSGTATAVPGVTSRTVTTGPDTILSTDRGNVVYYNSASAIAISQPAPTGSFVAGFFTTICNINSGVPTVTPGSGTIGGGATFALPVNGTAANPQCSSYQSDGTNFNLVPSYLVSAARLNATQTWSGVQTFGEVLGTVTTQAGTTYTFAATDCGTEVTFSNASAITATIPVTLPAGCNIAVAQIGAGKVSVNGSAVTPATLHSAHTFTGTSAQWAVVNVNIEANSGGSAAIALLTGDAS